MPMRANEDLSIKISKSSGKLSAYILWLGSEGRKKFSRIYGKEYNHRDNDDKEKMDHLYKSLTPKDVEHYKTLEKSNINSDKEKFNRRTKSNSVWRAAAHKNADRHHQVHMEHKRYVELERLRKGTHVPARPKRVDEPNTNMIQDLEVFCKKTVDRIADDLILLDGLHDQIYSEPMMFVGASTSYFNFDKINGDMYPLPLEMSTIVFNLKEGIKSVDTVDFNLDPLVVLQPQSEEALEKVREKINSEARYAGIPLQNAAIYTEDDMAEQWNRFKKSYESAGRRPRLLCEKRVLNQVKSTLRLLAAAAKDLDYFNAEVGRMVPIETLAVAMEKTSGVGISYEDVHQWFEKYLVPRGSRHYCSKIHERIEDPAIRVMCQEARGAMALHNLFELLNEFRILGFHEIYQVDKHNLCDLYRGKTTRMEERFHVPQRDRYLDPSVVPRTGLVNGFTIVPNEEEEDDIDPEALGRIISEFHPRSSRDDHEPMSDSDDDALPLFGRFSPTAPSFFSAGPSRSPESPHKPPRDSGVGRHSPRNWARHPAWENQYEPRQEPRQESRHDDPRGGRGSSQYNAPRGRGSSPPRSQDYPGRNGPRENDRQCYGRDPRDDYLAQNLHHVLSNSDDEMERSSLADPPRPRRGATQPRRVSPRPPHRYTPPGRPVTPPRQRYPTRCCWRIVPNEVIRNTKLWYSPKGAGFSPFAED